MSRNVGMSVVLGVVLAIFGLQGASAAVVPPDASNYDWAQGPPSEVVVMEDAHQRAAQPTALVVVPDAHDRAVTAQPVVVTDTGSTISWTRVALGALVVGALVVGLVALALGLARRPPHGPRPVTHG